MSLINMATNIVHPAVFAQVSRAKIPYVSQTKSDTFGGELKNAMLQRSDWLRKLTKQYPPSKVSIWGEQIDRTKDNELQRLFGWNSIDKDAFARPIYDDVVRTGDISYLPPSVPSKLNGVKLNVEQQTKLEQYVGQARKGYIAPYINDQAVIEGFEVEYSKLNDADKKYALQYLYELGKNDGQERLYNDYAELRPKEKETDHIKEIEQELFRMSQKYK